MNKKADFSLVEQLRESTLKKVDHDYLQIAVGKIKAESQALFATWQTENQLLNKSKFDKQEDRLTRSEQSLDKSLDEL